MVHGSSDGSCAACLAQCTVGRWQDAAAESSASLPLQRSFFNGIAGRVQAGRAISDVS